MTQLRHEAERAKQRPPTHTIHIQTETGASSSSTTTSPRPQSSPLGIASPGRSIPAHPSPSILETPNQQHRTLPETAHVVNNNYQPSNQGRFYWDILYAPIKEIQLMLVPSVLFWSPATAALPSLESRSRPTIQ